MPLRFKPVTVCHRATTATRPGVDLDDDRLLELDRLKNERGHNRKQRHGRVGSSEMVRPATQVIAKRYRRNPGLGNCELFPIGW